MTQKITAIFGIAVMAAVLLGGLAFSQSAFAGNSGGGPPGKVTICHVDVDDGGEPVTISVSIKALPAHLDHGDTLGPCGDEPQTCEELCVEEFNACLAGCDVGVDGDPNGGICEGICESNKQICLSFCPNG